MIAKSCCHPSVIDTFWCFLPFVLLFKLFFPLSHLAFLTHFCHLVLHPFFFPLCSIVTSLLSCLTSCFTSFIYAFCLISSLCCSINRLSLISLYTTSLPPILHICFLIFLFTLFLPFPFHILLSPCLFTITFIFTSIFIFVHFCPIFLLHFFHLYLPPSFSQSFILLTLSYLCHLICPSPFLRLLFFLAFLVASSLFIFPGLSTCYISIYNYCCLLLIPFIVNVSCLSLPLFFPLLISPCLPAARLSSTRH